MENYICINGRKVLLTDEQVIGLGVALPKATGDYSIAEVREIVQEGKARDFFKVHDVIKVGDYELEIIGFDHDKCSTAPGNHTMTVMTKSIVGKRRMNDGECPRGWIDTEMRKWLNGEFFNGLPEELRKVIVPATKTTHGSDRDLPYITEDLAFLPSESEMFGSAIWSDHMDGDRYEAFETSELRVRNDEDGDGVYFWERSATHATYFAHVNNNGLPNTGGASTARGVAPCFLIS